MTSLPSGAKLRSVRNKAMSSVALDTHNTAASGPVISVSAASGGVSSEIPIPGLMPPPITCDEAAEVEPIEPRLVAGYVRAVVSSGLVDTSPAALAATLGGPELPGAGGDRSK